MPVYFIHSIPLAKKAAGKSLIYTLAAIYNLGGIRILKVGYL